MWLSNHCSCTLLPQAPHTWTSCAHWPPLQPVSSLLLKTLLRLLTGFLSMLELVSLLWQSGPGRPPCLSSGPVAETEFALTVRSSIKALMGDCRVMWWSVMPRLCILGIPGHMRLPPSALRCLELFFKRKSLSCWGTIWGTSCRLWVGLCFFHRQLSLTACLHIGLSATPNRSAPKVVKRVHMAWSFWSFIAVLSVSCWSHSLLLSNQMISIQKGSILFCSFLSYNAPRLCFCKHTYF